MTRQAKRARALTLLPLAAMLIALALPAAAETRYLPGTKLRDYIQGTRGSDKIPLRGATDRGFGRRGHDRVGGGPGADRLRGGPGWDLVAGGAGSDAINGGWGADRLFGGAGADLLNARDGRRDRAIRGGRGTDICLLDPVELGRARGCELVSAPGDPRAAAAYGIWQPARGDSCPAWLHDAYSAVGPDAHRYPAWHPPAVRNPATGRRCTFGHEHGRNPAGSDLHGWIRAGLAAPGGAAPAEIPFGVANQALERYAAADGAVPTRHEDHVGHKVEWENDVQLERELDGSRVPIDVTCDFLTKVHQGSHSHDALGNNVHELLYAVRCDDGTELLVTKLATFGAPNAFSRSCEEGVPVPAGTSHTYPSGGGGRLIPDRECVERHLLVGAGELSDYELGLYEEWRSAGELRAADGQPLAFFDPAFSVLNPSRYAASSGAGAIARTIAVCFESEPGTGDRARGGYCEQARGYGGPLDFTDPRSRFDGALRQVIFGQTEISNAGGPISWHTDPYGGQGRPRPFPGSIRQHVAPTDNRRGFELAPQSFGGSRDYGSAGVHAPN